MDNINGTHGTRGAAATPQRGLPGAAATPRTPSSLKRTPRKRPTGAASHMRQPHMLQTLITAHLIAASPAAIAPTGGAAGHAGTSSAAGGTPRRPADRPHTTGPSGLDSPPATARPESLHQARVDGPPHVHVRGHGASRLGAQRPQTSTPGLSCGQAPGRQAPAATAAAAQTSAPISVSRREVLTTAAAQALPPSPSGAAGKADSVSSTDSGDERPAKAARQREADAPGTAGAANAAATANPVAGAEEVDVRRMFGSQDTEEGQDESPGGSQQEEPEGLEQQQQPGQRQQAQLHSSGSKGRRSGGGGAGAGGGNEDGGGHGGQQATPGGGDVDDGDVGDAHSEGGGGLVTDLGEDEEDLLCSQWQQQHSSPDRQPARHPGLAGDTDADNVGAEEAAAQGARPVTAAARRRPQRVAAQKANQKMGGQQRDPQLTAAAAGAQPGPQARCRPAAGSSLDDGGQATDSASGSGEAQGMEGAQEHEQLPPPPLQRDPRRPGYAPLLAALQHRAAAQRAARQGQQVPEAAAAEEGCGSSAWGVKLLGERRAVMNMVMGGDLAVLVGAALKDMTEKRLWTLPRRPVAHSSHSPVPLLDGNFGDTVLNKREAAEAKKAVLAQLTRKLRVAVHQRLRAEDPNFAGGPEGLTDAQIAANLPEYLPPSSKVVMSVIGQGPHPSVFDDAPALRGEDTLRVKSGCELQPYEVVGLYSGEAFLYEDWEVLTNADPEPGSHFSSLFARKHEFGRYAADARLPAPVVARLSELLDPELAGRLRHTEAARKLYVSAARLGCPVSAVNDPRRDVNACRPDFRATPNVAVEVVDLLGCLPLMVMFTLRHVPGDQELLYDYGDDYWRLHREESRAAAEADASAQMLEAEREARQRVEARARELEAALQTEREQRAAEQARAEADREQARRLEQALEEARAEALRLRGLAGGQGLMLANANAHVMDLEQQLVNLQEQRRLSQQEPQRQQQQQQQQQELGPHKPQASTPLPAPMVRCEIHNDSAAPAAAMGSAAVGPEKEPEEEVEEEVMEEVDVVVAADQQTPPQTPPHPLGEALSPRDDGLAVPAPAAEAETGGVDVGTAANEEPVTEAAAEAAAEAVAEVEAQAEAEAAAEAVAEAEAEEDLAVLDREAAATSAGGSPAAGTSGAAVGLASSTGAGLPPSPTVTELLASIGAHCDATNDAFRAIGLPGHADTSPAAAAARADGRGLYSGTAAAGVPAASARNGCFIAAAAARADAATAGPTSSGAAHAGAGSGAAEPDPSRDRHAAPGMVLVDTQAEQTKREVQLQEQATQEPRNSRKRPREAGERHRDRVKAEHIGKLSLRSSHRTKAVARATKAAEQATAAAEAARAAAAAAVKAATACVEEVAVERAAEALQCADEARQCGDEAVAAAEAARRTASNEAEEARAQAHKAVQAAGQAGQAQAAAEAAARAAMVAARAPAVAAATVKTDPSAQAAIVANRAASAAATEVIDLTMDEDD